MCVLALQSQVITASLHLSVSFCADTAADPVVSTGVVDGQGRVTVVVLNPSAHARNVSVVDVQRNVALSAELPPYGIQTLVYNQAT